MSAPPEHRQLAAFMLTPMVGYSALALRLLELKIEPTWDPLRWDPLFAALLKKVGRKK